MLVYFTKYNKKHNPTKGVMKYSIESNECLFLWGFKYKRECAPFFLIFGNLAVEKFWKYFRRVCMTPE